jgi:hypothetical protein
MPISYRQNFKNLLLEGTDLFPVKVLRLGFTRKIEQFRVTLRDITAKPNVTRNYAKANLKKKYFFNFFQIVFVCS